MRIFLEGNQDLAKWHLPVAEAKFKAFVERCKESGLKQDRFTFVFSEDGTTVYGQYYFGQESLQVYAPEKEVVIKEKSKDDLSVEVYQKTFYVNTSKGYYWVTVRYVDGVPEVKLTKFTAVKPSADGLSFDWVYPGFGLRAAGMIAGNFSDSADGRYVLSQNGGVMAGKRKEKGTVISTAIIDPASRINIVENIAFEHVFVLMLNHHQTPEVRHITVSHLNGDFIVERKYLSLEMSIEGETNIPTQNLQANPCWVHRKCTGSYFSPNKTIGYHVDIGTDDAFWGNISALGGGLQDKLDNTGGAGEPLFNHSKDLYRMVPFAAAPLSVEGSVVSFIVCTPTMLFDDNPANSKKCWGGYGLTQTWASCVDYMGDFNRWMLAPRLVKCDWDISTGEKTFKDFMAYRNANNEVVELLSWDGDFRGKFILDAKYECSTKFYEKFETVESEYCDWDEEISGNCDPQGDPIGFTGVAAKSFAVMEHWVYYSREILKNSKKIYFTFGTVPPDPYQPNDINGFCFMFDGLWHLDIGVHWSTGVNTGNQCGLMSMPLTGQTPGEKVWFVMCGGGDPQWIIENGSEYTRNLNVTRSLGLHMVPGVYGPYEALSFEAEVPESLAAPRDPEVCVGGIRYISEQVPGEIVECERRIMSRPCICAGNGMAWGQYASLGLDGVYPLYFSGGCPPFRWSTSGATLKDYAGNRLTSKQLEETRSVYAHTDKCRAKVSVTDACMSNIKKEATMPGGYTVSGPAGMQNKTSAYFSTNLPGPVYYSGHLQVISQSGGTFLLYAPEGSGTYLLTFTGKCGVVATKSVSVSNDPCAYGIPIGQGAWPGVNAVVTSGSAVYVIGPFINNFCIGVSNTPGSWGGPINTADIGPHFDHWISPGCADRYSYTQICP